MFVLVGEKSVKEAAEFTTLFSQFRDVEFHIVLDGNEVIDYLKGIHRYTDRQAYPFPSWMILNMEMPGRPALDVVKWLRSHPECSVVPTILICESCEPEQIKRAYEVGAVTVFPKPKTMEEANQLCALVKHYWELAAAPVLPTHQKCD